VGVQTYATGDDCSDLAVAVDLELP
jgi:hypothetical protein